MLAEGADAEVRLIVAASHDEVVALLNENRHRLDSLARALLEHETLDQQDAYAAAGIEPCAADPTGASTAAAAQLATVAPPS